MGIYDRDYYRRDGPSYLGSFLERGVICKWLIGINIVVFCFAGIVDESGRCAGSVTSGFCGPKRLDLNVSRRLRSRGQVWRLLSYTFLHAGPLHILFNMLFLWWFGTDVEELYGPARVSRLLFARGHSGGRPAVHAHVAAGVTCRRRYGPQRGRAPRGAVTAVMVLCAIHYPDENHRISSLCCRFRCGYSSSVR